MASLRFVANLFVLCVLAAAVSAQATLDVPYGKAAAIDGKVDAQEWADAARKDLANGVMMWIKTDGVHVYLAMRGTKQAWSHVYMNDGASSDLSVIHASAALGRIIYKQDDKKLWQPQNEFAWEVRQRAVNAETQGVMDAYLAKNGWVASNNNMGNPNEVE